MKKVSPKVESFLTHNLNILVEVHKLKLHNKYQKPGPSCFRKEDFKFFPYMSLCKTSDPWHGAIFDPWAII